MQRRRRASSAVVERLVLSCGAGRPEAICRIDYQRGAKARRLGFPLSALRRAMTSDSLAIAWTDDARRELFATWLAGAAERHALSGASLRSASADASFRRYFRIDGNAGAAFIVMDAPPPQEDV